MKHRVGTKLECDLPEGYDDERTLIALFNGRIVVCHPDFVPCTLVDGKLVPIQPSFRPPDTSIWARF